MSRAAWLGLFVVGCAGEGETTPVGAQTTPEVESDANGMWIGDCETFEGGSFEYQTVMITDLGLELVDEDGVLTGTWHSVASLMTTTTTYVNTTTEDYALTGTRDGDQVTIEVETDYPTTLDGEIAGDEMVLDLTVQRSETAAATCTLARQ